MKIALMIMGLVLTGMIAITLAYMGTRMTLLSSASEQGDLIDAIGPFPSFPPEVLTNGPTPPKDWPVDWRWKYSFVPGCSGRAIVSNRYVDRGGTGGYRRPDYIECSDGGQVASPLLDDGVLRTKQGWDQLAYSVCCSTTSCFVAEDPFTSSDEPDQWKCDANLCRKLVWKGTCRAGGHRDHSGQFTPPMCCSDARALGRR